MKYIITESQYTFLIEQETPNWFKRRYNAESMREYIDKAEEFYPTLCDDFGDEFDYADNVIMHAVREFMTTDEDIFEDERYDEWEERLVEMCKEKFGERLFEIYRTTCQEDDEMMFESDGKMNRIDELVFNYLDGENFKYWDEGDGEFNLTDGERGNDIFKFRLQFSSMDPEHSFDVLYINEKILHLVNNLFSMDSIDSRKLIIDWFNKKYDKNITDGDVEWFGWGDDEDDY